MKCWGKKNQGKKTKAPKSNVILSSDRRNDVCNTFHTEFVVNHVLTLWFLISNFAIAFESKIHFFFHWMNQRIKKKIAKQFARHKFGFVCTYSHSITSFNRLWNTQFRLLLYDFCSFSPQNSRMSIKNGNIVPKNKKKNNQKKKINNHWALFGHKVLLSRCINPNYHPGNEFCCVFRSVYDEIEERDALNSDVLSVAVTTNGSLLFVCIAFILVWRY